MRMEHLSQVCSGMPSLRMMSKYLVASFPWVRSAAMIASQGTSPIALVSGPNPRIPMGFPDLYASLCSILKSRSNSYSKMFDFGLEGSGFSRIFLILRSQVAISESRYASPDFSCTII